MARTLRNGYVYNGYAIHDGEWERYNVYFATNLPDSPLTIEDRISGAIVREVRDSRNIETQLADMLGLPVDEPEPESDPWRESYDADDNYQNAMAREDAARFTDSASDPTMPSVQRYDYGTVTFTHCGDAMFTVWRLQTGTGGFRVKYVGGSFQIDSDALFALPERSVTTDENGFCTACSWSPCQCHENDSNGDYLVTFCNVFGKEIRSIDYGAECVTARHIDGCLTEFHAPESIAALVGYCDDCGVEIYDGCADEQFSFLCPNCGDNRRTVAPVPHWHGYADIGGGYLPDHAESFDSLESAKLAVGEWVNEVSEFYADELNATDSLRESAEYEYDSSDYQLHVDPDGLYAYITGGIAFMRRYYVEECRDRQCEAYAEDMRS